MNISKHDETIVRALVRKLPEEQKDFLIMRFWECRTLADIAAILRVSVEEVENGLKEGMKKIEKLCLEQPNFSFSTFYKSRPKKWKKESELGETEGLRVVRV